MWFLQMLEQLCQSCMHSIRLTTVNVTLVLHTTCYVRPAAVFASLVPGRSASMQEVIWAISETDLLEGGPFLSHSLSFPPTPPPPSPLPQEIYLQCQQSLSDFYRSPGAVNHTDKCMLPETRCQIKDKSYDASYDTILCNALCVFHVVDKAG